MDQRIHQLQYRIEHEHGDGSWGAMIEQPAHNDPAAHDPERGWSLHRIFRCSRCGDSVTLVREEGPVPPDAE